MNKMNDHIRLEQARAMAAGAGISQEHLKFVLDYLDRRTTELLAANSRLVEERRTQTLRAEDAEKNITFLLAHNGISQLERVEAERSAALAEVENLRKQLATIIAERDDATEERNLAA
jgi:hypothetical protein